MKERRRDFSRGICSNEVYLLIHPSCTFSCLVAIKGFIGKRSDAAFPALSIMSLMQPTNDSIMYLTPCSFSSGLRPINYRMRFEVRMETKVKNTISYLYDSKFYRTNLLLIEEFFASKKNSNPQKLNSILFEKTSVKLASKSSQFKSTTKSSNWQCGSTF